MRETEKKQLLRFAVFAVVGLVDTLLDWSAFTLVRELFHAPAAACQTAGYLTGALSSYLLNGRLTFRDGSGRRWFQCLKFVLWNAASLGVSALLIQLLVRCGVPVYIAKLIITIEVGLFNYFGYKYLVFRVKKPQKESKKS